MIGTFAHWRGSEIWAVRYAISSVPGSACDRSATGFASMSRPPIFALRSTNCAGLILPDRSCASPYWTPTLSYGRLAKPSWSRRPQMATM